MRFLNELLEGLLCTGLMVLPLSVSAGQAGSNVVTKPSNYSVADTIDQIEKAVTTKGMKIFARIDHSGEAKNVGREMKPTQFLIFGNPKGGTALMVAKRTVAIDLPMKALRGKTRTGTYGSPITRPNCCKSDTVCRQNLRPGSSRWASCSNRR